MGLGEVVADTEPNAKVDGTEVGWFVGQAVWLERDSRLYSTLHVGTNVWPV